MQLQFLVLLTFMVGKALSGPLTSYGGGYISLLTFLHPDKLGFNDGAYEFSPQRRPTIVQDERQWVLLDWIFPGFSFSTSTCMLGLFFKLKFHKNKI